MPLLGTDGQGAVLLKKVPLFFVHIARIAIFAVQKSNMGTALLSNKT